MLNLGSRLPYPPPKEHALDSMGGLNDGDTDLLVGECALQVSCT